MCTPRLWHLFLCKLPLSHPHVWPLFGPHTGKLYPGGSLLDLQPEGGAGGFITTGHFWTSGSSNISRNGDKPQVWYQVLKLMSSSRVAWDPHHSTKQSLLPVVISLCLSVPENLHLLHTGLKSMNWRWKQGGEQSGRAGHGDRGRVSDVPWISWRSTSTESTQLRPVPPSCTLIYLSSVGNQMLALISVARTLRQLELKQNLRLNHGSDRGPEKSWISKSPRPGLNMHMLVHIQNTTKST